MIKMINGKLSCYEALPRETQESFNKFVIYRDLKPHERSITKVAEILGDTQNLKKTRDALIGYALNGVGLKESKYTMQTNN